ncbi:hypothetical protein DL96DRAFT_1821365 [Flagelloscypha sp. PMI_526]|nr:hypothetical protein DL96DRAFT_1821365 [Flagelloscypha sp. PMI_526]
MASSLVTPQILDETLGALFIGFGFSTALFGILSSQVVSYYRLFRADGLYIKVLVPLIWALEFVDQVFIAHGSYHYCVTLWGNPLGLIAEKPLWSLILGQTFGTVVGTLVKGVFAVRVWRFSGQNYLVTGVLAAVIILQFVCGMYYSNRALAQPTFVTSIVNLKTIATLSLSAGAVSDFITAAALAWYLRKMRTGYDNSDSLVNSLIVYGLGTGFVSGGMSLTTLILYNVKPQSFDTLASFFVLSKILAISFMTSLNTRKSSHSRGRSNSNSIPLSGTGQRSQTLTDKHAEAVYGLGAARTSETTVGVPASLATSELPPPLPEGRFGLQPNRARV